MNSRVAGLSCLISFLFIIEMTTAEEHEHVCRYCAAGHEHFLIPQGRELTGKYHYAPDRQVDVLHLKIDVTPDFQKRTVAGTTTLTLAPIAKPIKVLRLDAFDLDVKDVRCDVSEVIDFVASRRDLEVTFLKPLAPGTKFTVEVDYSAQPDGGLYFRTPAMGYPETDTHVWSQGETHGSPHWFPCFDYPNERSSSEVICHVPPEMTVLSNGRRMSETLDKNGLKAVRWLQEKPHVNYLICLVAGHFEKLEKQHRDIPLGFYTQPTLIQHAENSFRDTEKIMAFYEREIGMNYPWVKYDQVTIRDFTSGGMENTTLTTLTHRTIFSSATENIRTTRRLDAHELAHQWFGDYVTCKDWSHLWLNEGFATFYTHLYEGEKYGRDAMLYGLYTDATNKILTRSDDKRPIVFNAYKTPGEQFDYRAYPKGSWVLHMLRSQLGPELYRTCIREYLKKHALSSVVTDDLRQVIEEHSGQTMDRFFDQWVYHAAQPKLKITYRWLPESKLAKLNIKQTQTIDDDVLLFQFPVRIRFVVDRQVIDHPIEVTKLEEEFTFSLADNPSVVRFDPDYSVLAEIDFNKSDALLKAQIQRQDDMIGRLLACVALGKRGTHQSVELLSTALDNDPFYGVRIAAAAALAKHDSQEADQALVQNWQKQTDARVRLAVVQHLVKRFSDRTPELIESLLTAEQNPAIQATAIKALGKFHGEPARKILVKSLASNSFNNELAMAAITAISQQNDPAYKATLMNVLKQREQDFSSRDFGRGLAALATITHAEDEKSDVRKFLAGYLNHPQTNVRTGAINALGALGDRRSLSILESFQESRNERIAKAAKDALSKLRELQPPSPKELVELRKELAKVKTESEKMRKELDAIRDQLKLKK